MRKYKNKKMKLKNSRTELRSVRLSLRGANIAAKVADELRLKYYNETQELKSKNAELQNIFFKISALIPACSDTPSGIAQSMSLIVNR